MSFHTAPRIYSQPWTDYALLDAGGGKKLERFGKLITIRPEVQAYFPSVLPFSKWNELAHAEFKENSKQEGSWKKLKTDLPDHWEILVDQLTVKLEFTRFKHVGIFPEQAVNWRWLQERITPGMQVLNLFAYTGMASLVCRAAGAEVTHVDSMRQLVSWSRENMELSHLSDIRWVVDDALKFAQREMKRGHKYDVLIMDPPAFGRGANGEKWILEKQLPLLMETAAALLHPKGALLVNTYSPKVELNDLKNLAQRFFPKRPAECAELWMKSASDKDLYFGNLLRIG